MIPEPELEPAPSLVAYLRDTLVWTYIPTCNHSRALARTHTRTHAHTGGVRRPDPTHRERLIAEPRFNPLELEVY